MPTPAAPTDPLKGTAWGDLQPTDYSKLSGYTVTATLFGLDGYAGPFLLGGTIAVPLVQSCKSDSEGRWVMELYGNDQLVPAGSYWRVEQADSNLSKVLELESGTSINVGVIAGEDFPTGGSFTPPALFVTMPGDPNADRLVFWDDSAGAYAFLTVGTGLTLVGTTLTASAGGSGLTIGTTTVTGGTSGRVLYNNAGVVGELDLAAVYQAKDATLTAFAVLTIAANSLTLGTGADAFSQTTFAASTFPARASTGNLEAKTISDDALTFLAAANQAAMRSAIGAGTGSGTVTTLSVVTANGVSGSVANATTTPAITLTLGAITPTSVTASGIISGTSTTYEHVFDLNPAGVTDAREINTGLVINRHASATSGWRFADKDFNAASNNSEKAAVGYGNASQGAPYGGVAFLASSDLSGVAPYSPTTLVPIRFIQYGHGGAVGDYVPLELDEDGNINIYRGPWATKTKSALLSQNTGNPWAITYGLEQSLASWKDETPAKAWSIGSGAVGAGVGDDFVINCYNGSAWFERFRLTNAGVLTSGATGAGFTIALSTSTVTGNLPDARNTVSNSTTTTLSAVTTLGASGVATSLPGALTNSKSGAASTAAMLFSGVPFAGTGTTSFPLVYICDANATASTTLNTAGTYFGINGDGSQDLANLMRDGVSRFKINSVGELTSTNGNGGGKIVTSANQVIFNDTIFFGNTTAEFQIAILMEAGRTVGFTDGYSSGDVFINRPSAGTLNIGTNTTNSLGSLNLNNLTASGAIVGGVQGLTGAGVVNLTTLTTELETTGASQAITLANGTHGQIKIIIHGVDGGSAVLTPTTATGWTTATFTFAGESLTLQFLTTRGWVVLATNGAVLNP